MGRLISRGSFIKGKMCLCASGSTACFIGLTSPASILAWRTAFLAAVIEFFAGFVDLITFFAALDLVAFGADLPTDRMVGAILILWFFGFRKRTVEERLKIELRNG